MDDKCNCGGDLEEVKIKLPNRTPTMSMNFGSSYPPSFHSLKPKLYYCVVCGYTKVLM
jgi:hypothetical protein